MAAIRRGFQLDNWQVYPESNRLGRDGAEVEIEPRVMDLLVYLAERPGEVVSRQELLDQVWADRVVNDEALSRAASLLRKALGDSAGDPRFLRTVPRRGYQLVAAVRPVASAVAAGMPARPPRWPIVVGVTLALAVVAVAFALYPGAPDSNAPAPAIAVLPFQPLGDTESSVIGAALAMEIAHNLAANSRLQISDMTRTLESATATIDPRELARQMDVAYLLEGRIQREGDTYRVFASLVDAAGKQAWSLARSGSEASLLALQQDLSIAIAEALDRHFDAGREAELRVWPGTHSEAANRLWIQARYLTGRRNAGDIERAIALYQEAIAADPEFVRAYDGLVEAYYMSARYSDMRFWDDALKAKAKPWAQKALALDPARAQFSAYQADTLDIDHDRALPDSWLGRLRVAEQNLRLNPYCITCINEVDRQYSNAGQQRRSLQAIEAAIRRDPLNAGLRANQAWACARAAEYDCIREATDIMAELGAGESRQYRALRSNYCDATDAWDACPWSTEAERNPTDGPWAAFGRARDGDEAAREAFLAGLRASPKLSIPQRLAADALGAYEIVDAQVEQAISAGDVSWLPGAFRLGELVETDEGTCPGAIWHRPERYELLADLGLLDYWQQTAPPDCCDLRPELPLCQWIEAQDDPRLADAADR